MVSIGQSRAKHDAGTPLSVAAGLPSPRGAVTRSRASSSPIDPPLTSGSETPGEDPRAFSALGSAVRLRILNAIATREKGIPELARELRLHRLTVRYHLGYLRTEGFVEEVTPSGLHKAGRPAALYRASRHAHVPSFPQRHFEVLGQLALEALVEAVGEKAGSRFLRAKGLAMGRQMIQELAARVGVKGWSPEAFERIVLNGLFRDFGIPSEVLSRSPSGLAYRSFGCPFLELAERMPSLVCNSLDRGFHEGVDQALGGASTERVACMGHGDPFCEYITTWKTRAAARARRARPEGKGRSTVVRKPGGPGRAA